MSLRSGRRGAHAELDRALRRSLRAAVEGDAARARTWLERAVELDSADLDTYHALARLYRDCGEVGRAIRMHQNVVLRSGIGREDLAAAKLELARDFEAGGFLDRAIALYEELLAARPKDAELLESLASRLIERGELERARELLRRLRRRDEERANRVAGRLAPRTGAPPADGAGGSGLVSRLVAGLASLGREDATLRALSKRLARVPDDHEAILERARLHVGRGEPERAREELARALERDPGAWALHVALGRLWLSSGQEGEALKAYARLLDALDDGEPGPRVGRRDAACADEEASS